MGSVAASIDFRIHERALTPLPPSPSKVRGLAVTVHYSWKYIRNYNYRAGRKYYAVKKHRPGQQVGCVCRDWQVITWGTPIGWALSVPCPTTPSPSPVPRRHSKGAFEKCGCMSPRRPGFHRILTIVVGEWRLGNAQ